MQKYAAVIIVAACVMTGAIAHAETLPDMGNPGEVTSINCSVEEVKFLAPSWGPIRGSFRGMFYVVALEVSSNTDINNVFLGPAMYLDRQDLKIGRYDSLEVTGFKKVYDGKPTLVAQEIRKGGHVFKLRDQNGVPLWGDPKPKKVSY